MNDHPKPLKVLLVSPRLPDNDRNYNGDYAYTDTLLKYPPLNVNYKHFLDLINDGHAQQIGTYHKVGPRLQSLGILPPDLWAEYLKINVPFDLVHIYGFSVVLKFPKNIRPIPYILSISTGSFSDLKYYHNWNEKKIRFFRKIKRIYLRSIGAVDTSLNPGKAKTVLVWSEFSRKLHLEEGYVQPDQIQVLYPGLIKQNKTEFKQGKNLVFLFIGRDFKRKNGFSVVDAFKKIHLNHPSCQLIIVGNPGDNQIIDSPGIIHKLTLPRNEILNSIYPSADVLILPSKAEGFGLVIVEAMSYGIPTIGIKDWAMTEIIHHGENGFLIDRDFHNELEKYMLKFLVEPDLCIKMEQRCLEIFTNKFSIDIHNDKLRKIYDEAIIKNGNYE